MAAAAASSRPRCSRKKAEACRSSSGNIAGLSSPDAYSEVGGAVGRSGESHSGAGSGAGQAAGTPGTRHARIGAVQRRRRRDPDVRSDHPPRLRGQCRVGDGRRAGSPQPRRAGQDRQSRYRRRPGAPVRGRRQQRRHALRPPRRGRGGGTQAEKRLGGVSLDADARPARKVRFNDFNVGASRHDELPANVGSRSRRTTRSWS
jgi:hypothetical protein